MGRPALPVHGLENGCFMFPECMLKAGALHASDREVSKLLGCKSDLHNRSWVAEFISGLLCPSLGITAPTVPRGKQKLWKVVVSSGHVFAAAGEGTGSALTMSSSKLGAIR